MSQGEKVPARYHPRHLTMVQNYEVCHQKPDEKALLTEEVFYICVYFLELGTINATRYCDTLSKLKEAIRKKRPGLLRSGVLLLDADARPHLTPATKNHLAIFDWDHLHHPPYSPDLAPSDFHLFPALIKNITRGALEAIPKSKMKMLRHLHLAA
ncbi:histone-lysine N-methyltransferase SETMAR [Trichonephila clavipes]|nr:histone-lysine N-methyltransferase SETMAR [Trichonephila clavipes]